MQQTKFRMLRWCLSIRHYWGSVGFSNRYVSLIFHLRSPEMSRTYPSSIHILQHVAKWIDSYLSWCSQDLNQCNPLLLNFQSTEFLTARKGSPAHGGWHWISSWTAWIRRTNPKELGWNPICFTGSGLASEVFEVYRYDMSSTHQCLQIFTCEKNLGLSVWTTKCLAWSDPMPKAELLRHTQQRLTTEVERWLFSFWRIQTKCLGILLRPLWW